MAESCRLPLIAGSRSVFFPNQLRSWPRIKTGIGSASKKVELIGIWSYKKLIGRVFCYLNCHWNILRQIVPVTSIFLLNRIRKIGTGTY